MFCLCNLESGKLQRGLFSSSDGFSLFCFQENLPKKSPKTSWHYRYFKCKMKLGWLLFLGLAHLHLSINLSSISENPLFQADQTKYVFFWRKCVRKLPRALIEFLWGEGGRRYRIIGILRWLILTASYKCSLRYMSTLATNPDIKETKSSNRRFEKGKMNVKCFNC